MKPRLTDSPYHPDYGIPDDVRIAAINLSLETTRQYAADLYHVNVQTLNKWRRDFGITNTYRLPEALSVVKHMLVISTAHVSEITSWYLNDWSKDITLPTPAIVYNKDEFGWFVYVPYAPGQELGTDFPADLGACMEYARSLNCNWIMFEQYGVTIDELPVYDW